MARLARVYPLQLATLLFLLGLVLFLPGFRASYASYYFTMDSFITNLFLIQNWGITHIGWNMVSWSISAEWFMYLLFPAMLYLSRYIDRMYIALAGILIIPIFYLVLSALNLKGYGGISLGGMIRVSFEFTLGFILCLLSDYLEEFYTKWDGKLIYMAMTSILISLAYPSHLTYLFLPSAAILISHLAVIECDISKFLSNKLFVYIGEISFSIYMWQWILINMQNQFRRDGFIIINSTQSILTQTIITLLLLIYISHYSHKYIESPARALIKRMAK